MSTPLSRAMTVAVIGGGPAGLMAAEVVAGAGAAVTVYEHMPSVGRKLLLAGRGGLNITHSEPRDDFLARYGAAAPVLAPAVERFGPEALRAWCAGLGQEPFVGTSGRVFPSGFRATALLRAWLERLTALGVEIRVGHRWQGWSDDGSLSFTDADGAPLRVAPAATVLALGGASWPRVGSDGAWVAPLTGAGITVAPLRSANCGFDVAWTEGFVERFAGTPLKNVTLTSGALSTRGDAVVTDTGIEGGAVYGVARALRDTLGREPAAVLHVDLCPDVSETQLAGRFARGRAKDSAATALRRAAKLSPVGVGLLREATGNHLPKDATGLAALVKAVPLTVVAPQSLERAISTAGGVVFAELDPSYMVRRRPGTFVAGEMLDWEAPTGGYLLQATFSTAVAAAEGVVAWLGEQRVDEAPVE